MSDARERLGWVLFTATLCTSVLGAPGITLAQESHFHASAAAGHAVAEPQSHEFGWGGQLGLGYELRFGKVVGIEAQIDAYDLASGDAPIDPRIARHGNGAGVDGFLALRVWPLGRLIRGGPWLETGAGVGLAGSLARAVLEARVGYSLVHWGSDDRWHAGPFLGFTQVVQPDDTLRPDDARLLWAGVYVELDASGEASARLDRDGDTVYDDEDACVDVAGVRTRDGRTNGCPPPPPPRLDRDADDIPDDVDSCPDVRGLVTSDPRTNGCPPRVADRDHDAILDRDDACPDVAGIRTEDPKTDGCPLPPDRDKDGILDHDDACPDVPGLHTDDLKTNGCPPATKVVRVEGDQILLGDVIHFEIGSPRVKHASWPLVKKLADYFQSTPDIEEVDIEGHADEVGTSEYNLYLSRERAAAVKALLINFGVDARTLTTHAYGEEHPRAAGHDSLARKENRRVEFTITRARAGTTPAQPQAPGSAPRDPAVAPKGGP